MLLRTSVTELRSERCHDSLSKRAFHLLAGLASVLQKTKSLAFNT